MPVVAGRGGETGRGNRAGLIRFRLELLGTGLWLLWAMLAESLLEVEAVGSVCSLSVLTGEGRFVS